MILNNGWNIIGTVPSISYNGLSAVDTGLSVTDINGVSHILCLPYQWDHNMDQESKAFIYTCNPKMYLNGLWVKIGTGTTPPTLTDYCLENDVTNQFKNIKMTMNSTVNNGRGIITFIITGTNPGGVTHKITEIGIGKLCTCDWDTSTSSLMYVKDIMYIREVLDNPFFVHPGQGFTLSLEWSLN